MKDFKHQLANLTWVEATEVYANDPVILLPLGSMEIQGPHSVMGDYQAAEEIAKRAAVEGDAYMLPILPFAYSEYFRDAVGTITLSHNAFYQVVREEIECVLAHGATKIIIVNGHGGNSFILDELARDILREYGIRIVRYNPWQSAMRPDVKLAVYGDEKAASGHGSEPLTSIFHYLKPECMRNDLLEANEVIGTKKGWEAFNTVGMGQIKLTHGDAFMPFNMTEVAPRAVTNDPFLGNAEYGEKLVKILTDNLVELIGQMKKSDMHANK